MNPRELVDHIRSGPVKLVLYKPFRFHPRTPSSPREFNEFLQVLQSSETIRDVTCLSQLSLSISEEQWVLLVRTIGRIKDIQHLEFSCKPGSRDDFHPFQAVADAVNNAHSLCKLNVLTLRSFPRDDLSELTALANTLRKHTALQAFNWFDYTSRRAPRDLPWILCSGHCQLVPTSGRLSS
jgi:hypothetical protein